MISKLLIIYTLLHSLFCISQNEPYSSKHTLSNSVGNKTLIDSLSGVSFVLDSNQIYITAIKSNGDTLWRTDPYLDNDLPEYRVKRPIIVGYYLQNNQSTNNTEVIWMIYNNTQFGILEKETGKYTWFGQD